MRPELLAALALAAAPSKALEIVFNDTGVAQGFTALSPQALAGFEAAASLWEALLADPVTVRIDVATYNFGSSNIIGQASSTLYEGPYTELRDAWIGDVTSTTDLAVLSRLPTGLTYTRRINRTVGLSDPATPVLATTDGMYINGANAKALSLLPGDFNAVDATIEFNSAFAFDYDRSNGISVGQMDFIGVAAHEIGHALGFISVVDYIDGGSVPTELAWHMPMDFLRYSDASLALGVTDTSIDAQRRFLALGNLGILVSTGVNFGDGQQASHFLDNVGLGMMDPTADNGELRLFTGYDLVIFDALGWDLTPEALNLASAAMAAIPEPSTYGLALGALGLAWAVRRRRKAS